MRACPSRVHGTPPRNLERRLTGCGSDSASCSDFCVLLGAEPDSSVAGGKWPMDQHAPRVRTDRSATNAAAATRTGRALGVSSGSAIPGLVVGRSRGLTTPGNRESLGRGSLRSDSPLAACWPRAPPSWCPQGRSTARPTARSSWTRLWRLKE